MHFSTRSSSASVFLLLTCGIGLAVSGKPGDDVYDYDDNAASGASLSSSKSQAASAASASGGSSSSSSSSDSLQTLASEVADAYAGTDEKKREVAPAASSSSSAPVVDDAKLQRIDNSASSASAAASNKEAKREAVTESPPPPPPAPAPAAAVPVPIPEVVAPEKVSKNKRIVFGSAMTANRIRRKFPLVFCDLERDNGIICPGVKRGNYMDQFYYDPVINRCQHFVYNGCGGNANRFSSLWECNLSCAKKNLATIKVL